MSASDLAPFVAAVIEDGIVAELQRKNEELNHKIEELESNIQDRDIMHDYWYKLPDRNVILNMVKSH